VKEEKFQKIKQAELRKLINKGQLKQKNKRSGKQRRKNRGDWESESEEWESSGTMSEGSER
jgi:hypothetical protein